MGMMAAYKMLGATPEKLLAFRLALIGWMGSSQDNSLYEILYGSHLVGVKGKEDLSEAARMYMAVDPLTVEQLRREAAIDNEFPHERVFNKMLKRIAARRAGKQDKAAPEFNDYLTSRAVSNGSAQDRGHQYLYHQRLSGDQSVSTIRRRTGLVDRPQEDQR